MRYTTFQDAALLVLRLIVAAVFLYAGTAEWFLWTTPVEGMSMSLVNLMRFLSIVEPIGAVALIAGFLTRWAGAGLAIIMFGSFFFVYFMMHAGFFTSPAGTGMDYNVLIFGGSLVLAAFGAGAWSVDALMHKSKA